MLNNEITWLFNKSFFKKEVFMTDFLGLLQEWNGGILRGAKVNLARALGISANTVKTWCNYSEKPSEIQTKKMATLFKKKEEEIKKAFGLGREKKLSFELSGHRGENISGDIHQSVKYNEKLLRNTEKSSRGDSRA
jgi:hypothetical protein